MPPPILGKRIEIPPCMPSKLKRNTKLYRESRRGAQRSMYQTGLILCRCPEKSSRQRANQYLVRHLNSTLLATAPCRHCLWSLEEPPSVLQPAPKHLLRHLARQPASSCRSQLSCMHGEAAPDRPVVGAQLVLEALAQQTNKQTTQTTIKLTTINHLQLSRTKNSHM